MRLEEFDFDAMSIEFNPCFFIAEWRGLRKNRQAKKVGCWLRAYDLFSVS